MTAEFAPTVPDLQRQLEEMTGIAEQALAELADMTRQRDELAEAAADHAALEASNRAQSLGEQGAGHV